jgi:hypothetical protein
MGGWIMRMTRVGIDSDYVCYVTVGEWWVIVRSGGLIASSPLIET